MPRKYVKKYAVSPVDCRKLLSAIKMVKGSEVSLRAAARCNNICCVTLGRHLKNVNQQFINFSNATEGELLEFLEEKTTLGGKRIFNADQEVALSKYVLKYAKINDGGMTKEEMKHLVYEFAKISEVKYPPSWNKTEKASKDWLNGFLKRHPHLVTCNAAGLKTNPEYSTIVRVYKI